MKACVLKIMMSVKLNKNKIMKYTILGVFLLIIIPIIINWMYKTPAVHPIFAVDWGVEEAITLYGSLLSAAATIYALIRTINFTIENQRIERKLSIRPYLQTEMFYAKDIGRISEDSDRLYLGIRRDCVTYSAILPDDVLKMKDLQKKLDAGDQIDENAKVLLDRQKETLFKNRHFLQYDIKNCGAGNAIDVFLKINNKETSPRFCVTTSEIKKVMLIFDKSLLDGENQTYICNVSFVYSDIASLGKYIQEEEIILFRDNEGNLKTKIRMDKLLTAPVDIDAKECFL